MRRTPDDGQISHSPLPPHGSPTDVALPLICALTLSKPEVAMTDKVRTEFWGGQIEDVMTEIARQATICDVKLLAPGMIEAVLHNNAAACGSTNPIAFKKMREMLMMGFVMREKSVERLGALETQELVAIIREHLQKRFDKLGGPSG
jgi:hypothetical protein